MANTSTFGFSNTTSGESVPTYAIGACTNYAKVADEPEMAQLKNRTCPLDQGETLTYRAKSVGHVSTSLPIANPTKIRNGVQYVIKLEEVLRTTDADGKIIADEPVIAYLTIAHQNSSNIKSSHVETVVERLLGACQHADGTWRFDDLMRSALVPVTD